MRRTLVLLATMFALLSLAASAQAQSRTFCQSHVTKRTYTKDYWSVARKFSRRTPGRNIRKYGLTDHKRSNCADLKRSIRTFKRWLAPPVAPVYHSDVAPTAHETAPDQTGGAYSIPSYIVQCESHGSYTARNASGAYGAYQIMPGTASAYGCSLATPAGQDACAAKIYADVGSSAWSCG